MAFYFYKGIVYQKEKKNVGPLIGERTLKLFGEARVKRAATPLTDLFTEVYGLGVNWPFQPCTGLTEAQAAGL